MKSWFTAAVLPVLLWGATANAQYATPTPTPEGGAEVPPAAVATPVPPPSGYTAMFGKFTTNIYGFVEADSILDTTQSFVDLAGNGTIAKGNTYAGNHGRMQFGMRNSRLGFKIYAPETNGIKVSGWAEMDFLGNQASTATEAQFYNNAAFRVRHMLVTAETPVVDISAGQTWELFGWQSYFHPASVEIQGLPGQIFSRTEQVRLSKKFSMDAVTVDVAIAALRPPQRDSEVPDGQAGLRVILNNMNAWHTTGATGSKSDGAGIGVSGALRRFDVENVFVNGAANPNPNTIGTDGYGISIDAMVPIIPGTAEHHGNALTLTGSYVNGAGIADLYTGLSGGVSFPTLSATSAGGGAVDADPGIVAFDSQHNLRPVAWQSDMIGIQYYLPPGGNVWVALNGSQMWSSNSTDFGTASKIVHASRWADACLFWDMTPAVRFGAEYAYFEQTYGDGHRARDNRAQFSAFFIF